MSGVGASKKSVYYNEIDPYAAQWLRNLIEAGYIAHGIVDERSIEDVTPSDLRGFTQCHFFAGIGVWSYALRQAGWPDDRPVWTGSCPCQPFSSAGKGGGVEDERHLWPAFFRLISACRPSIVLGEQVASHHVTGRETGKADYLRSVRQREEFRRVSHSRLKEEIQGYLQGLSERAGAAEAAQQPNADGGATQRLAAQQPWVGAGVVGSMQGQRKGDRVRFGSGRHPGEDQSGPMRNDRYQLRFERGLEQPIPGQGGRDEGLHHQKRASGADCAERNDEPLGAGSCLADCGCATHQGGDEEAQRMLAALFGGSPETQDAGSWIDLVQDDLEGLDYAFGAIPFPASSVGAPHIRDRLYWVADANDDGAASFISGLGLTNSNGCEQGRTSTEAMGHGYSVDATGCDGRLAHAVMQQRPDGQPRLGNVNDATGRQQGAATTAGLRVDMRHSPTTNGFWQDADWLLCMDGKWRPVEPGTFPLAHGAPARVGRLRAYGNAINAEAARVFVESVMESS